MENFGGNERGEKRRVKREEKRRRREKGSFSQEIPLLHCQYTKWQTYLGRKYCEKKKETKELQVTILFLPFSLFFSP
jgi:hypothetical protein